jgi:hypothetical protein
MSFAERSNAGTAEAWTPPRILAAVVGAVYTLIGLVGFFVTGFSGFASSDGHSLMGFHVNPLHNFVHLLVGLLGLALSRRTSTARTYGWVLAAAYGVVFIYGLFAVGNPDINFLALNGADNVLHVLTAVLGVAMALWPVRRTATAFNR